MSKLLNMDALSFMHTLESNSIDLIVTNPPYRTTKRGGTGNSGGMCKKKEFSEGKVFKYNNIKPQEYIQEFYRILKDGSHCYIMTNHVNLLEMLKVANDCGFHFIKSLIWNKGNKIMGQAYICLNLSIFYSLGRENLKKLIIVEPRIY